MTPDIACELCIHLDRQAATGYRCVAFPEGIPEVIAIGKNQHRRPVEGDGGTQWEPRFDSGSADDQ